MRDSSVVNLDQLLETFLYQVSDVSWAKLLWKPAFRKSIVSLIEEQFGSSSADDARSFISLQALYAIIDSLWHTLSKYVNNPIIDAALSNIASNKGNEGHLDLDTSEIFSSISLAISLDVSLIPSHPKLLEALLHAYTFSALLSIVSIPIAQLSTTYRTHVDFVRQKFNSPSCEAMRQVTISSIKAVVAEVHAANKPDAVALLSSFLKTYTLSRLCDSLASIRRDIKHELKPRLFLVSPRDPPSQKLNTVRPSFFSDSDGHDNKPTTSPKRRRRRYPTRNMIQQLAASQPLKRARRGHSKQLVPAAQRPCAPLNAARTERQDSDSNCDDAGEPVSSSHFLSDLRQFARARVPFPSSLSSCDDICDKINELSRPDLAEGPSSLPQVLLGESGKEPLNSVKSNEPEPRTQEINSKDSSDVDSDIAADDKLPHTIADICESENDGMVENPGQGGDGGAETSGQEDDGGAETPGQEDDGGSEHPGQEDEGAETPGQRDDGKTDKSIEGDLEVQDEHDLDDDVTPKLSERTRRRIERHRGRHLGQNSNKSLTPKPAKNSHLTTAGKAKRSNLDNPGSNARDASPIPESVASPMRPRRRTRRKSTAGSDGVVDDPDETYSDAGAVPRNRLFGKFSQEEDEWLTEGLEKYGWGSWATIAKNFGGGKASYTRNGVSLKDRARSMGLDPSKYQKPGGRLESRGRRGKTVLFKGKVSADGGLPIENSGSGTSGEEE